MYDRVHFRNSTVKADFLRRYNIDLAKLAREIVEEAPEKIQYQIGANCIISDQAWIDDTAEVVIGNEVLIAAEVNIYRHDHGEQFVPYIPELHENIYFTNDMVIGNNVFIGKRTFILPQCRSIGNNVTIGAGSIVTKDIPDNEIWGGNPATKIKNKPGVKGFSVFTGKEFD